MNDEDRCPATNRNDERCGHPQAWGVPEKDEGPCKFHGGLSTGGSGDGAPTGNTHAATHGLYVETNATYQQILSDAERQLVDDIFVDYLADYEERHGEASTGTEAELFRIAVSYGKHVHADNWAVEKPDSLESGNAAVDKETRISESGEEYYKYKETIVAKGQRSLSRDRRAWLKDLGLLDDPQSQTADAIGSLKDAWKASAQGESQ